MLHKENTKEMWLWTVQLYVCWTKPY